MIEFLKTTVEWQGWGWNAATIGAIGTFIFTVLQGYGFFTQGAEVWKNRSGESVSVVMNGFWMAYVCAFFIYGLDARSIAMLWNCVCISFPLVFTLAGLWKYKRHAVRDWWTVASFFLAVPAMLYFPKDIVYGALLTVAYGTLLHQAYEVRRHGAGVLSTTYILIFIATGVFWLIFCTAIGNWLLVGFNALTVPTWTYILYRCRISRAR